LRALGIVRKIDKAGRLGIPLGMMRRLGWLPKKGRKEVTVEMFAIDGPFGGVLIRPYFDDHMADDEGEED